jgi:hypothetical protein
MWHRLVLVKNQCFGGKFCRNLQGSKYQLVDSSYINYAALCENQNTKRELLYFLIIISNRKGVQNNSIIHVFVNRTLGSFHISIRSAFGMLTLALTPSWQELEASNSYSINWDYG